MADDITNIVLLQHIQAMKSGLEGKMDTMQQALLLRITALEMALANLTTQTHQGFEEARQHRQALQEDLEETMRVLAKHGTKLARL